MNLQAHHSGKTARQVQSQPGGILLGLPPQNNSALPQMPNPSIHGGDFMLHRQYMQEKICEFLMKRHQNPHEVPSKKMIDIVKRLEEALFKNFKSTEDYLNLATLESRLHHLIRGIQMSTQNQRFQHANSSSAASTMIPTPGLQQNAHPSLTGTSSVDNSLLANNSSNTIMSSVNSGSFIPTENGSLGAVHDGSFSSSDGILAGGFHHSSSTLAGNSGGNNMTQLTGVQRMTSQMIPTPGFNSSNNSDIYHTTNTQSLVNSESTNNAAPFSSVQSSVESHMQHKTHGGQNRRMLHNIGGHMGSGIRSTMQPKSYGLSNGLLHGGLMGNDVSLTNDPGTSEGFSSGTMHANNTIQLQQQLDLHQQPLIQGDGHGIGNASGHGHPYVSVTSAGTVTNSQSLNAKQSMSKENIPLMTSNQPNIHSAQPMINLKHQSEKINFHSQHMARENLVQNRHVQHSSSKQFQQQKLVEHQIQQRQQTPSSFSSSGQSRLASNMVSNLRSGPQGDHRVEGLESQVDNSIMFSNMQNQFLQNTNEDRSRATQLISHSSDPLDAMAQTSDHMQQLFHPSHFVSNQQSDFGGLSSGFEQNAAIHGQWHSRSNDSSRVSTRIIPDQGEQNEYYQKITGQSLVNNLSSEESIIGQRGASRSAEHVNGSASASRLDKPDRARQYRNQLRWLLFLRHARSCPAPEGKCQESNCLTVQRLLKHMENCNFWVS